MHHARFDRGDCDTGCIEHVQSDGCRFQVISCLVPGLALEGGVVMVLGGGEADHGVGLKEFGVRHSFRLVAGVADKVAVLVEPVNLKL